MTPPLAKARLVGMLSLSAKTVNLSATPSPSVSSQMTMRSRPLPGRLQLVGIVDVSATHSRPRSSQFMQIGLLDLRLRRRRA